MTIHQNYSLKNLNTFGINVFAKYFSRCEDDEHLLQVLDFTHKNKLTSLVLGGGSNILFTQNFGGIVFQYLRNEIREVEKKNDSIILEVSAGKNWDELVAFCASKNYGGIENLSLIPGTVGAAPIQNIGAYGQEFSDVFTSLKGVFVDSNEVFEMSSADCKLGYRNSIFKNELQNKVVITAVTIELTTQPKLNINYGDLKDALQNFSGDDYTVKDVREAVIRIRKSKLPDPADIGNAGSFFKNPEVGNDLFDSLKKNFQDLKFFRINSSMYKIPAAWLIEKCGLKGYRAGNVGVHQNQPLVIVNFGNAEPEEILSLKNKIQNEVYDKFNIRLEEEVNII